ncbi:MAG: YceI family protein [Sphingobium sp.]
MTKTTSLIALALVAAAAAPIIAQMPTEAPGKPDPKRVTAGTYATDPHHTLVGWRVNHMGFNDYFGQFGDVTGTLILDPAAPAKAKVDVTIPVASLSTASAALTKHLSGPDFFDAAKFPTARFVSSSVKVTGTKAEIAGTLTIRGIAKPAVLHASFVGAGKGMGPQGPGKDTVGFHATTKINRADYGIGYGIALVPDPVVLEITAAFEKQS